MPFLLPLASPWLFDAVKCCQCRGLSSFPAAATWRCLPAVSGALLCSKPEEDPEPNNITVTAETVSELRKQLCCPELLRYLPCLVDERVVNGVFEVSFGLRLSLGATFFELGRK